MQEVKMSSISQDEIVMAVSHMTVEQLTAMLNTIPGDFVCGHRQYQPLFSTKVKSVQKDREWRSTEGILLPPAED